MVKDVNLEVKHQDQEDQEVEQVQYQEHLMQEELVMLEVIHHQKEIQEEQQILIVQQVEVEHQVLEIMHQDGQDQEVQEEMDHQLHLYLDHHHNHITINLTEKLSQVEVVEVDQALEEQVDRVVVEQE